MAELGAARPRPKPRPTSRSSRVPLARRKSRVRPRCGRRRGRSGEGQSLAQDHRAPDRGARGLGARRRAGAGENPTRRGVTVWVETDGTVYWAVPENLVPTHGDGANRNDNKFIDNADTFHHVVKTNSIGVEFAGNYPDVAAPATPAQLAAWDILVRVLQERYGIPSDRIYAHNWIDFKDARYCEGCDLARRARELNFVPGQTRGEVRARA